MWSDWKPEVVDRDFAQLSKNGVRIMRIFPLWSDFQPIHQLYTAQGRVKEIAFQNSPLPNTEVGKNGVPQAALDKFKTVAGLRWSASWG